MREKKGQAAMEFLMTYGWAILVVLIAIGALAYFGVLNPSKFLPESCTIGPGIGCDDFKIVEDGTTTLLIRNGMGEGLTAVTVTLEAACTGSVTIADGAQETYTCAGTAGTAGDKYKQDISFAYTAGDLPHSKTGTLTAKYES
ncbi:hypothetical protein K8R33_02115 [archaeon]|nr:hypothetical protein [archaeon]